MTSSDRVDTTQIRALADETKIVSATWFTAERLGSDHTIEWPDAEFIAACSPDVVRSLCDEVDELRAQVAAVEALAERGEHGALRWEHPLPVPEWVGRVRAALSSSVPDKERE